MLQIHITGIHPALDGEYPLEIERFKNKDWRTLKSMAGATPLTLGDQLKDGDNNVVVAFAAIVLRYAGKDVPESALWDADSGLIKLSSDEDEAASPPTPEVQDEPNESGSTSGGSSSSTGEPSQATGTESPSGDQNSEASA